MLNLCINIMTKESFLIVGYPIDIIQFIKNYDLKFKVNNLNDLYDALESMKKKNLINYNNKSDIYLLLVHLVAFDSISLNDYELYVCSNEYNGQITDANKLINKDDTILKKYNIFKSKMIKPDDFKLRFVQCDINKGTECYYLNWHDN